MSDLPSDPPRLHAILAYLDRQVADHETVGFYLRLQREAVRKAIAAADPGSARRPRRERPAPQQRPAGPFVSEQSPHVDGSAGVIIHVAGCEMVKKPVASFGAEKARWALTKDRTFGKPCEHCRPGTRLGILD
ncbi:DUF6233 domain-containing protein [Streptomyces sp. NPDC048297]|uniref:DUF6233 domain-containing protein n=1 Tax=Streptomyces sp. NPDC048297 TaxID=3365531 RepID=UPI00371E5FD4